MIRSAVYTIVLCALVAAAKAKTDLNFTDCGSPDVTIQSVYVEPDLPKFRDTMYLTTKGIANKKVTGGHFTLTLIFKYRSFQLPIFLVRGRICGLGFEAAQHCSFKQGEEFTFTYKHQLPVVALDGDYTLAVSAQQADGRPLLCFTAPYTLHITPAVHESRYLEDRRFLRTT